MTDFLTRRTPAWRADAAAAFQAAIRRDHHEIEAAVGRIVAEHGPDVIPDVLLAWVDTTLRQIGLTPRSGTPMPMAFTDACTGETSENANDVHPAVAWAGRLMNARLADDLDLWTSLLESAQSDNRTWTQHVLTAVGVCAATATNILNREDHH